MLAVVVVAATAALVRGFARLLYLPQEVLLLAASCCVAALFTPLNAEGNLLSHIHAYIYTHSR